MSVLTSFRFFKSGTCNLSGSAEPSSSSMSKYSLLIMCLVPTYTWTTTMFKWSLSLATFNQAMFGRTCTCFLHRGQVFVGAVWNHWRRLGQAGKMNNQPLKTPGLCLLYNIYLLDNSLPFVVKRVSAVDGSDISGVIEEIGANCAIRSDRHLMSLSHGSPCSQWFNGTVLFSI